MNFTCMHPTRLCTSNPREAMKEKPKVSNARAVSYAVALKSKIIVSSRKQQLSMHACRASG